MIKKFSLIFSLVGGILFAQNTDLEKEKIINSPKFVEESFTKAIIRANIIEDYIQEYYTKTKYNTFGNISEKEFYSEAGELVFTETYTYDTENKLIKSEMINPEENFIVIKDYEYTPEGYKETKSENDIIIAINEYKIDANKKMIYQKETSMLEDGIFTERKNEYHQDQLIKTIVNYGKDGYTVTYKYDQNNLPIEEVIHDLKNNLVSKKRRKYDDKLNLIEEYLYDSTGRLKTNNRIKYEYDEKGNWTTRTQYANNLEQPVSNTKRTIRY